MKTAAADFSKQLHHLKALEHKAVAKLDAEQHQFDSTVKTLEKEEPSMKPTLVKTAKHVDHKFSVERSAIEAKFKHAIDALKAHQPPAKTPTKASHGKITTLAEANKSFITQWGRTKFNSSGVPYGFKDCAPTSSVMVASSLGLMKNPTPGTAEKDIDHMRDLERGHNTHVSSATSSGQIVKGLNALGGAGTARLEKPSLKNLDHLLANGHRAVIMGHPWRAWGDSLMKQGHYLNHRDPGEHACCIVGKTADGHYLMGDPLSKKGFVEVTGKQVEEFWHDAGRDAGMVNVCKAK